MKKVLATINPDIKNPSNLTYKGLVENCSKYGDARFIPSNGINFDFKNNKVRMMEYKKGNLIDIGYHTPEADLWIVYSDGFKTNTKALGYARPTDYHEKLMSFLEKQVLDGNIGQVINSPNTERKTLKKYFAGLDSNKFNIIPTYLFKDFEELYVKFKEKKKLVVKPDWGGGSAGVDLLKNEADIMKYRKSDLTDIVFQEYYPGDEKRMWITDGKFVEGRIAGNRNPPWMKLEGNSMVNYFNLESAKQKETWFTEEQFNTNLLAVEKIIEKTGLQMGSVDFLGDKINELNGGGTGFFFRDRDMTKMIDARKHLNNYIKSLLIKND